MLLSPPPAVIKGPAVSGHAGINPAAEGTPNPALEQIIAQAGVLGGESLVVAALLLHPLEFLFRYHRLGNQTLQTHPVFFGPRPRAAVAVGTGSPLLGSHRLGLEGLHYPRISTIR